MKKPTLVVALLSTVFSSNMAVAQTNDATFQYMFDKVGTAERRQLVPMRDGVGLSTDVYLPKGTAKGLPTIYIRTPYNTDQMYPDELELILDAMGRGYAVVVQSERGRYFSEGKWEILGRPQTDGYDALSWIAKQGWSNGKVGTIGCSSSAEWQLALAAQNHPAHAAMIPMASGAGIGTVGRFQEQGNWFTGGAVRTLFTVWLYETENKARAQLPSGLDPKIRTRVAEFNDLDTKKPEVDWSKQIKHLPVADILQNLGEPSGVFEDLIKLKPASPEWWKGGLYQQTSKWGVPALWFNSWYDVSTGPNMELFNHIRATSTDAEARDNQYAVVAPRAHCEFDKLGPDNVVGERNLGDTSLDVDREIFSWFDRWLKGDKAAFAADTPHVRYYAMGENKWKGSAQWPPKEAEAMRLYLTSDGRANSLFGNGRLSDQLPQGDGQDHFTYDPMNPVQTFGGNDCCNGGLSAAGALDQRSIEARGDVLVYTSEPMTDDLEVSGFIDAVLQVSSDAKDTDFAVKIVDVAPDGTAWILGDTIFRARYREGFDREVWMAPGKVYSLKPSPIATSNVFQKGHRIRVEVTSSNFPKFFRNLNTGGDNITETKSVVANNGVHYSAGKPSYIELPVIRRK